MNRGVACKLSTVDLRATTVLGPKTEDGELGSHLNVRHLTASKSQACREGHTSGPCRWLFSATRPVGDVKSLKALHRYNVVKAPAFAKATAWQANDEHA